MEADVRNVQRTAALMIERAWVAYSSRKLFALMKELITKAERNMTFKFARGLSHEEAALLKDPFCKARVRFRLGGEVFPPKVLFKIFTKSQTHYYHAKRLIPAGSIGARDALNVSGRWPFLKHVLDLHYHSPIESVDITSQNEFVQFMASLDARHAHLGGRQNNWRELKLEDLLPPKKQRAKWKERWISAHRSKKRVNNGAEIRKAVVVATRDFDEDVLGDGDFEDLYEWTVALDEV
ncbi:hypothetical protein SmJEL517_g01928 [Synchytrium microbalum]|uniref:Uncharacterized protein n=1 Tax=Synchytrium microbalum TaxID=1806994 RepID=A0A507C3X2_9FUNG|nr:uncharacterized protein SmJEL517_g01928 [Synchytrium microbalum]TPX35667.1 hypothetical protein SmJEL517_g01928 [Synchytrium microbalum]